MPKFSLEKIIAHLIEAEDSIPHLYQDIYGNVTTGVGCLVSVKDVIDLPLVRKSDGSEASPTEKLSEYNRVKMRNPGLLASQYALDCRLKLMPQGIKELLSKRVTNILAEIAVAFPVTGEDGHSESAFYGLFDMCFNSGVAAIRKWPKFAPAYDRGDYETCEKECTVQDSDPITGLNRWEKRNAYRVQKFQDALCERVR